MITVTKEFGFDAAHRLLHHGGKCRHLHGHRYTVLLTVRAGPGLHGCGAVNEHGVDDTGLVVDFACLKEDVGTWIDENLDHGTIVNWLDTGLVHFCQVEQSKHYLMPSNPTAENIALEIYRVASELLRKRGVYVWRVEVLETPTCGAVYEPPRT